MPEPVSPDPAAATEALDPCAAVAPAGCEEALAQLYHYLDGELTIERRTVIRTHLEFCSPCGDRYTFETELRQVVSMRCRDRVPDALRLRVAEALRREIEGR
ncbi:MAG: mycothiol system anti-sigma-R factor [Acidimicrobiales bacterium]